MKIVLLILGAVLLTVVGGVIYVLYGITKQGQNYRKNQ